MFHSAISVIFLVTGLIGYGCGAGIGIDGVISLFLPLPGYMLIALIYARFSRAYQVLKLLKLNEGNRRHFDFWKHIYADAIPTIDVKVDCYHRHVSNGRWETVAVYEEGKQTGTKQVWKEDVERRHTLVTTENIPYTTWWIGDGKIPTCCCPQEVESQSKTLDIGPHEGKMTFAQFSYSCEAADDYTKKALRDAKTAIYDKYKDKKRCCKIDTCEVTEPEFVYEKGIEKIVLKPESLELPDFCKPGQFWKYTVLPLPYFNGAKIRQIIDEELSIDFRKNIVRYVEIKPDTVGTWNNSVKPGVDTSRGYERS